MAIEPSHDDKEVTEGPPPPADKKKRRKWIRHLVNGTVSVLLSALTLFAAKELYDVSDQIGHQLRVVSRQFASPGSCPRASSSGDDAEGTDLAIFGSDTIGEDLMPNLIGKYYEGRYPGVDFTSCGTLSDAEILFTLPSRWPLKFSVYLSRRGTETGFDSLLSGKADIGMASDRAEASVVERARSRRGDLHDADQEKVIGLDGVVILVSRDNPVNKLSLSQVKDIFCGDINDWQEVGGEQGSITRYYRDENSGTFNWVNHKIQCSSGKMTDLDKQKRSRSSGELRDRIGQDKRGIGFVGFAYRGGNTKPLNLGTDCGLVFAPTFDSIRSEEYPWTRRLFLYKPMNSAHAREADEFIRFVMDPGQAMLEQKGFVSLAPELLDGPPGRDWRAVTADLSSDQLQPVYASLAANGVRIRTTLRFASASKEIGDLDPLARQDLAHLGDYLRRQARNGYKIAIVGFTDSVASRRPSLDRNRELSKTRANDIASRLSNVPGITSFGLGERSPVACNTDEDGRNANRRVEIWLYRDAPEPPRRS
jgi:phosphate transport system substrate-binding protein